MNAPSPDRRPATPTGVHVATVAYQGRIWETWLDFDDDPRRPTTFRARFRFESPEGDTVHRAVTTALIIEESYEDAIKKAMSFDDRALHGLLRSALPDDLG